MPKRQNVPSCPRAAVRINPKLEKNLLAYTAVGAAGVALAAIAQPAEAKVVYNPSTINIPCCSPVQLDINGDGVADFAVSFTAGFVGFRTSNLVVKPLVTGNAVRCQGFSCDSVAPGFFGVPVGGPGEKFATHGYDGGGVFMAAFVNYGKTYFFGPWAGLTNRYVGLKFVIGSTTHYGWARMTVNNWWLGGTVSINGYAYETTPNTKIVEGHISGPAKRSDVGQDERVAPQPPSLGLLAMGADGLVVWRRDDVAAAQEHI